VTLLDGFRIESRPPRSERRRLAAIDHATAHRALLVRTRDALGVAEGVIAHGWLQERWFAWRDGEGREWLAGSAGAHTVPLDAVSRACLVGALVVGAGGAASPVLRSEVEATWHALHADRGPVDWVRSPAVAEVHVRALTSWNDRAGRTADEVRGLLADAGAVLERELAASADRLAALA
jgi:hypothetical protein